MKPSNIFSQRVFNFSPGPAALPLEVLEQIQSELFNWRNSGMSVMEVSHRGQAFIEMLEEVKEDIQQLLNIPANYEILFLHGGASTQFAMLPLNLTRGFTQADYIDTGHWSRKAMEEAQRYCKVNIVAKIADEKPYRIPAINSWHCNENAAYLHYTSNETLLGVQFYEIPSVSVPLVTDMTSDILSRPLEVERFGVIYAAAQKNIGIAGLTLLIIRDDLLDRFVPQTLAVFNYGLQAKNNSLTNTVNTFACYVAGLIMKWLKKQGGLEAIYKINQRKAEKLYSAIDNSKGFYNNLVAPEYRSMMNVSFHLPSPQLEQHFLTQAELEGLVNLRGHKAVGGIRASIYNAVPEAAVEKLIGFMQEFATK